MLCACILALALPVMPFSAFSMQLKWYLSCEVFPKYPRILFFISTFSIYVYVFVSHQSVRIGSLSGMPGLFSVLHCSINVCSINKIMTESSYISQLFENLTIILAILSAKPEMVRHFSVFWHQGLTSTLGGTDTRVVICYQLPAVCCFSSQSFTLFV